MKKEPKKPEVIISPEPPKQKKEEFPHMIAFLGTVFLIGLFFVLSTFMYRDLAEGVSETNRLLSTFQRMDTVKEEPKDHWFCAYVGLKKQFCINSGAVGQARIPEEIIPYAGDDPKYGVFCDGCKKNRFTSDPQSDPNLCNKWKTNCHDSAIGPQCDVVCSIGEGVE